MSSRSYDVVTIGDFRFPGGTSTAIAEELHAQAAAGYRTGIIPVKGPTLKYPHPFHPKIRACIDEGLVDLLDPDLPVSAGLVLAHHPDLFTHLPRRSLRVQGDTRLLIVHHPPFDGWGQPFYDWATIDRNARETLGGEVHWAPIGPTVRDQLASVDEPPRLVEQDWFNILDADPWFDGRDGFCQSRPVIGRHSRPDPLKWPEDPATALTVYPDDPRFVVRVLGGGSFLRNLVGQYPPNWQVMPFNAMPPERFVQTIDFFVYYHHSRWVEAFGRTIIEAMASGAVALLPPSFAALFGDGAVYAAPDEVRGKIRALYADWSGFQTQSACGRTMVRERFSHAAHVQRLDALLGPPHRAVHPATSPRSQRRRAMFLTSNGVGMGHLARMLAIAKRCPEPIEPVFVTLSQAMKVVHQQGFLAEYLPYHLYLDCDIDRWNDFLREELGEMLAFYDPAVVLFDGNVPYHGLLEVMDANPDPWFVWCRRGMWRPGHGGGVIDRERQFDAVLEPRDLAEAQDHGLTAQHRGLTRAVDPIRLLDAAEILPRDQARQQLGLSNDRPTALLQLGSGNNYDYSAMQKAALAKLTQHGVQVVQGEWLIADTPTETPASVQVLSTYPFSRYFNAFDLVISAVGYNSFHELLLAGVPTIFVPNEHPQQDDQLGRARFAERHGLAICVRTREIYRLGAAIDRLLDPEENRAIRTRCAELDQSNGATEAARFVEEMTFSRKIDRP